jgi:hypothetical protein
MSGEGDIVLIHIKDQPTIYGRVEAIEPDIKKGWYRVTLLLLSIPQQIITWILREEYINGATFTMDGNPIMMKEIKRITQSKADKNMTQEDAGTAETHEEKKGKVLQFKGNTKSNGIKVS